MGGTRKPDVIERKDGRIELRGMAYAKMKNKLRQLAGNRCEQCGCYTMVGDAHHGKGRGAGKRDDRIFVNGERNLFYFCRGCHSGKHVPAKVVPAKMSESEFDAMLGLDSPAVEREETNL